jgi:hypothetical protein
MWDICRRQVRISLGDMRGSREKSVESIESRRDPTRDISTFSMTFRVSSRYMPMPLVNFTKSAVFHGLGQHGVVTRAAFLEDLLRQSIYWQRERLVSMPASQTYYLWVS